MILSPCFLTTEDSFWSYDAFLRALASTSQAQERNKTTHDAHSSLRVCIDNRFAQIIRDMATTKTVHSNDVFFYRLRRGTHRMTGISPPLPP
ncbi:unnamed protein product [Arctogadus glacialis]